MSQFKIVVLISGGGTTLKNLIDYSNRGQLEAEIVGVVSSNPTAAGLEHAKTAGIETFIVDPRQHSAIEPFSDAIFAICQDLNVSLVVMGGFLRRVKIPAEFCNRVINIHPSLIPAFSGKGHYGMRVHQAVLDYGCKISGCTVHFVDDDYDHGPIIAQEMVPVHENDTPESLAKRVFAKECEIFPITINAIARRKIKVANRKVTGRLDDGL